MKSPRLTRLLPSWKNAALAVLSAILLVLAFPDFEFSFLAFVALVPMLWAIERERESAFRSFLVGWLFGLVFFTGTCWWLTFAPMTYATPRFPAWLAYLLLLAVTGPVGIFPGIFAAIMSTLSRRFGSIAILAAPFVWVLTEFLRYWLTGNNWNAIGYSQALGGPESFSGIPAVLLTEMARVGGVLLTGGVIAAINSAALLLLLERSKKSLLHIGSFIGLLAAFSAVVIFTSIRAESAPNAAAGIVAIQPNVPMSGLNEAKWRQLRQNHIELAEAALSQLTTDHRPPTTVIFPESPMNFMWEEDDEFRNFVHRFAAKHDVQVLFNSAEPDAPNNKYFNSAVLVGPDGKEVAQYDKIYLLPFGESVPAPLQAIVPAFVGNFSYGKEYDLLPLGEARAGVMICFESHFGELSREYVRNGADVIIEMTNDGYLGPTPVLRQHLANAVFRAVETNRPVIRATNVGVTAYITERGEIRDPTESYSEATRVWTVAKSDGSQTFYVKYGDWFAWLCSIVTIGLLGWALVRPRRELHVTVPPA